MADSAGTPGSKAFARAVFWPVFVIAVVAFSFYAANRYGDTKASVVFITADTTPYWDRVVDGAKDAADQYGVDLRIIEPDGTLNAQNGSLNDAATGADAIVISPVDGVRQTGKLRDLARTSVLVTVDSDSEMSDRVCFVGMDNYVAGQSAAGLVRAALPSGGRILVAAGPLDKTNGQERRQGLIDALLEREGRSELNADPIDTEITGSKFEIAGTIVDDLDPATATRQIADALRADPEIDAVVGLYAYHATAAAEAVRVAAPDRSVTLVGFDALPETLDAIENGAVYGVIAQDQYGYGFHSVRMAAEAVEGYDNAPLSGTLALPPLRVTLVSLDRVREDLGLAKP
jgi:ribose transport system substrate-binding protein